MVILDYKGIAPQKLEKIIRMVILREISSLELPEIKEEDQCHKVYQHSEIINKIKCAKFQIFWTLSTHTFQLAKSAPKCHFSTWDLLNLLDLHNFLTQVLDFDSRRPPLLVFFLFSDASNYQTKAFAPLGNSDHVVAPVSINFLSNLKWDAPFHCLAYDYSCADWDGLCDHLRDVLWKIIFKLGASAAVSEFCECVQVGIDVYIPHHMYQIQPHSSMVLSCLHCCHSVWKSLFCLCSINLNVQ